MPISLNTVRQKLRRIRIDTGGHEDAYDENYQRELCIMEATSYVIGDKEYLEKYSFSPPCVSDVISEFLIEINDNWMSDRKRARLKGLIPTIVGTVPTKKLKNGEIRRDPKGGILRKKEKERQRLVDEARAAFPRRLKTSYWEPDIDYNSVTFPQVEKLVKQLAAV